MLVSAFGREGHFKRRASRFLPYFPSYIGVLYMVSILERFQGESKLQVKNCRKFVILRVIVMKGPQIWFVITRVHCTLVHFTEKIYTEFVRQNPRDQEV